MAFGGRCGQYIAKSDAVDIKDGSTAYPVLCCGGRVLDHPSSPSGRSAFAQGSRSLEDLVVHSPEGGSLLVDISLLPHSFSLEHSRLSVLCA